MQEGLMKQLYLLIIFILFIVVLYSVAQDNITEISNDQQNSLLLTNNADTLMSDTLMQDQDIDSLLNKSEINTQNDSLTDNKPGEISFKDSTHQSSAIQFRSIDNPAFDVGEKLTFVIRYGPIKAGNAIMSIPDTVHVRNMPCYRIVSEAFSNKFFSTFFEVRDKAESHTDMQGIFSWHFEKHIREGKYHADRLVDFDHTNQIAVRGKDTLAIPLYVQDVLSALYFVRTQDIKVGKSILVDNYADNKLYPLEVKVHKKERKRVQAGEFDCVVVEPILRASGIFEHKGRLWVWLTDDEHHIPVLMQSKIIIGSIIAELTEMEGIKKE